MEARADDIARDVDPRARLAAWLRTGRVQRKLSLDDVARVTKIQPRILEKLETGCSEGLPADVFVRGFVRSVARCVGLDEREALERYGACAAPSALPAAQAFVDTMRVRASATGSSAEIAVPAVDAVEEVVAPVMIEVAPVVPAPVVPEAAPVVPVAIEVVVPVAAEVAPVVADAAPVVADAAPKKRRRKRKRAADSRQVIARATEVAPEAPAAEAPAAPVAVTPAAVPAIEVVDARATWKPTMPPLAASSVPWQRPFVAPSAPTLVIDDADPESADQVRDAREAARAPNRVSFLPPILLDRDDASGRQGGLTLAVIILLIAATLTLSYLMRRPSLSGDGVTMSDHVTHHIA